MDKWLGDRTRIPRRPQIKIEAESVRVGLLDVQESQVHDGVRLTTGVHPEANLTRNEARVLAEWLMKWATSSEGVLNDRDDSPEDVTRLEIDVRWSSRGDSSYYHRDERADLLKGWIESALCDRDDSPEVVSFKAS